MTGIEVFLDQLRDRGGDLVNISSVAGRVAPAGFAAYAATKWGINAIERHYHRTASAPGRR
jgi:NAD(P)-dependent dehydrogenase (short-subunit alcohol dehydrogenase family)